MTAAPLQQQVARGLITRRLVLGGLAALGLALPTPGRPARAAGATRIDFGDLYGAVGVLGLVFSETVTTLAGRRVTMRGYMAPPLKAEADFFVLTEIPMSICPFCASDADWPDNIVVIYLDAAQTFEQANALIEAEGTLEVGSRTDPATGFVSRLRIVGARFRRA